MTKVLLGHLKVDAGAASKGEVIYLEKHEWSCDWYWSFGWIGNKNLHMHFEAFLADNLYADELFETTNITNNEWWVIRDLMVQAYALQKAAEVYRCGGGQTTKAGITNILTDADKTKVLNADLEKVLETMWEYVSEAAAFERG